MVSINSPFLSFPKPLFQSEANGKAIDMKVIQLIFRRKVLHLGSFWKWEFLKLGSARYEGFDLRVEEGRGGKLWIRWEKYF